jgi:hypothetical protein
VSLVALQAFSEALARIINKRASKLIVTSGGERKVQTTGTNICLYPESGSTNVPSERVCLYFDWVVIISSGYKHSRLGTNTSRKFLG